MKNLLFLVPLLLASCVTSDDLRRVADQIDAVQAVAADESRSHAEVRAALAEARREIEDVVEEVEARTEKTITGLGESAEGGLIGLLGVLGLHVFRNHRRKVRGEAV